jgi:hypothetical protein
LKKLVRLVDQYTKLSTYHHNFKLSDAGGRGLPEKSGVVVRRQRWDADWGGMPVVVSPTALMARSHIPDPWIRLAAGIVPTAVIRNLQSALKNLRGGDNYALA